MRPQVLGIGYWLALGTLVVGIVLPAQAQTYRFSTLVSFKNNGKDPAFPVAPLIIDAAGNLYGTSENGGVKGSGTVFKVSKSAALSVLHSFGVDDGGGPFVGLARDKKGDLYGIGGGTVAFKLTPSGQFTILHTLSGSDGEPAGQPVVDAEGNVYSTAQNGSTGGGNVFEINTSNAFTVLYNFCSLGNCTDGEEPNDPIRDDEGTIYGSTFFGGTQQNGTVFKLDPAGVETVLYSFTGVEDGCGPGDKLKRDTVGNLYGTTLGCGTLGGGTLFKVPASGAETILYNFCLNCAGGNTPLGQVQIDNAGNFYGIAFATANETSPVVWKVDSAGKETVLYTFSKNTRICPGITIDSAGNLYGATTTGGTSKLGSIFKLTLVK
jgi:uncharacterized repeat protein (TIGR03803 family)